MKLTPENEHLVPIVVEMQRRRVSTPEIAKELGISNRMVKYMLAVSGHDAVTYHADAIVEAYCSGKGMYPCLRMCGIPICEENSERVYALLEARGVKIRRGGPRVIEIYQKPIAASPLEPGVGGRLTEKQAERELDSGWLDRNLKQRRLRGPVGRTGSSAPIRSL